MILKELVKLMSRYDASVGGSSDVWIDFVKDIQVIYGVHPLHMAARELEVSSHTAAVWTNVAKGNVDSYNPQTGKRR